MIMCFGTQLKNLINHLIGCELFNLMEFLPALNDLYEYSELLK